MTDTILVIDDDPDIQRLIQIHLRLNGEVLRQLFQCVTCFKW